MLSDIDIVTKMLQSRGLNLSDCADDIDVLLDSIKSNKNIPSAALHRSKFEGHHVTTLNSFQSGVIKLQHGQQYQKDRNEKYEPRSLRKVRVLKIR